MSERHHHHDHHDHDHDATSPELRTEALESLLREKGWITGEAIDRIVERYEREIGPMRGAQVVARAWTDPAFKARLLADGRRDLRTVRGDRDRRLHGLDRHALLRRSHRRR